MENTVLQYIIRILSETGLIGECLGDDFLNSYKFEEISADGSLRKFFRILDISGTSLCVGVYPDKPEGVPLAEARAAMAIGRHLQGKRVKIPEILAEDKLTGLILFEDCGDTRLHDVIEVDRQAGHGFSERVERLYNQVIEGLVYMQWYGVQGFERDWCYDTPEYDNEVMVKKEAEYFLHAFWRDLIGGDIPSGITEEFYDIAAHAAQGVSSLFLHRDFQSRNIMVVDDGVRFIDFQGGRIGPPGYDIASLLIDPYSFLDEQKKEELLTVYLGLLQQFVDFDEQNFLKQYDYLALQRNLQIVGAFAFLYKKRGKYFFKNYIIPALEHLCRLINKNTLSHYPILRSIVESGMSLAKKHL